MQYRNLDGTFAPRPVSLQPTKELGYFCGFVLGDCTIYGSKSGNYTIALETTKRKTIEYFSEHAQKLKLNPSRVYARVKTRRFPNGQVITNNCYMIVINSKILYTALRPYKKKDFYWSIPIFLTTTESKLGFIGGMFDAEGTVCDKKNGMFLSIASKQKQNLLHFRKLLEKLGFLYGKLSINEHGTCYELRIYGMCNIKKFFDVIPLHLKRDKLMQAILQRKKKRTREEYKRVIELRRKFGFGGENISKITKIPVSTIEDWIYKETEPWEVKYTNLNPNYIPSIPPKI
jgi:intein-encoded DNA endonuclease-like protein